MQVGQLAGVQAALDDTNQRLFELRVEVRWPGCCPPQLGMGVAQFKGLPCTVERHTLMQSPCSQLVSPLTTPACRCRMGPRMPALLLPPPSARCAATLAIVKQHHQFG